MAVSVSSEALAPPTASAEASLGPGALALRLSLDGASAHAGLGLEAKEEEMGIVGALSLASADDRSARLVAGPGSASGAARLLVDPTSPSPLSSGPPVELDASLQSRSSVLGLSSESAALFAIAEGRGIERDLHAAALGLSFGLDGAAGGLSGVVAASCDGPATESSGWRPDPSASPSMIAADGERPMASAGLVAQRRGPSGSSLAALAASYGRLAGLGLALRLESRERAGPLSLSVAAGAAGSSFRQLSGPRQGRLFEAAAEARLALRRAASIGAAVEVMAEGAGLSYAPSWGRKGSLRLILPILGAARVFDARLEAESPAGGAALGGLSCALSSAAASLGASLRWDDALAGVKLSLRTRLAYEGGLPELGLDLALELLDKGKAESPVKATGGLRLDLPLRPGSSVLLEAALPEEGLVLAPGVGSDRVSGLALSLRYRVSSALDAASRSQR